MDQPVLVVPVNHSGKAPKKIILATDLIQIDDLDVLDAMLAIARKFHAEVIIVNVTGGEERQKVQQAIHRLDFNNHFSGIKSRIEVVDHHDIVAGIRKYAHQQKADLLVVFPKHYPSFKSMFRKSITRNVVKHSDIPVLII
jgi:nucleotide-binding universal stress UspA family protein